MKRVSSWGRSSTFFLARVAATSASKVFDGILASHISLEGILTPQIIARGYNLYVTDIVYKYNKTWRFVKLFVLLRIFIFTSIRSPIFFFVRFFIIDFTHETLGKFYNKAELKPARNIKRAMREYKRKNMTVNAVERLCSPRFSSQQIQLVQWRKCDSRQEMRVYRDLGQLFSTIPHSEPLSIINWLVDYKDEKFVYTMYSHNNDKVYKYR